MTVRCCPLIVPDDELLIAERQGAVVAVQFGSDRGTLARTIGVRQDEIEWSDGAGSRARRQLEEYFAGRRKVFDLPLAPSGTRFQREVWKALCEVRFGRTCSYADIAARIGRPRAVRAVGAANGRNPIAIVIPCHRVIGRSGALTGYAAGLDRKARLLRHEGVLLP